MATTSLSWPQWFTQYLAVNPNANPAAAYQLWQQSSMPSLASLLGGDTPDLAYNPTGVNSFYASSPATSGASLPEGETAPVIDPVTGQITQGVTPYGEANYSLMGGLTEGLGLPILALAGGAAYGGAGAGEAGYGGAGDYAAADGSSVLAGGTAGTGGTIAGGTGDATLLGGDGADIIPSSNAGVGVEGGTAGTTAGTTDLGGGLTVDQYGNVTNGLMQGGPGTAGATDFAALGTDATTGAAVAGTASGAVPGGTVGGTTGAATAATAGTALSRVLDGTGTTADWLSVLGTAGITGLSVAGANDQANTLQNIYDQMAARRQPYLDQSMAWMSDPSSYINGPGQAALSGVLRGLSVNGNPMGSGTSLGIATEAGLRNWQNAVTGFGNLGLSGEDTRAQVGMGAANAQGNVYNDIGRGIGQITNPPTSLANYLRMSGLV